MELTRDNLRWRGRSLDEMTREELVEALLQSCNLNMNYMHPFAIECRAIGRVEAMKRGIVPATKSQPL